MEPRASRTAWEVKFSLGMRLTKCFWRRFSLRMMSKTVVSASSRWAPRSLCWASDEMVRHVDVPSEVVVVAEEGEMMGRLQARQVRLVKALVVDFREAMAVGVGSKSGDVRR